MCGALRGLRLSRRGILLSVVFSVFAVHAKTIAWYRFEEQTSGVTTQTSVFTNTIDAAKYPAYPAVCSFKNGTYDKQNLLYTPEVMPIYTNAFPSTLALSAPGDSDVLLENRGAVAVNMDNVNDRNNPVGAVLIDDHEDLRLQTFTIEFFTRIPQTVYGSNYQWRHLVSRTTSTYGEETFLIRGQNGDYMYPQYEFSTPLYDDSGTLTNFCKYSGSIYVRIDDDRWHHIAMTVDGDAKKVRFFIDHVLRKEVSYTGDLWYESGYPLAFGTNPQCSYAGCSEAIDEIRISDEALEVHEMLRYCRAGGRSEAVDENTLFYFPFEGSTQPQILGEGDVADPITYVPFYANASKNVTWGAYDAVPNQKSSVTLVPPVPSEDVPTDGVRFGLRGETFQENGTSLHLKTNAPGDYVQPLVLPESFNQEALASESFTAEMYFKAVKPGYMATQEQTHFFVLVDAFSVVVTEKDGLWSSGWLQATIGGVILSREHSIESQRLYIPDYIDGQWHHLAIVYDKENSRGEFWLDGKLALWKDDLNYVPKTHPTYPDHIYIGGSIWTDRSVGNMLFDDVRISRGALRPYQFLTTRPIDPAGNLLARMTFEDGISLMPYAGFFPTPEPGVFAEGGVAPDTENVKPARVLTAGKDGETVTDANKKSLRFDGGRVVCSDAALLSDTDTFTVEFFINAPSATAGAGIARVNRGSTTGITETVTWALSFANASGELALKVDTDVESGQSHVFEGVSFADGQWHHLGLQFEPVGSDTIVKLYRDAVHAGTWEVSGRLPTAPRESNFMLGAGESPEAGFTGWIDELRVTPGITDPSEFLTPVRFGMTLIIK